MKFRKSFVVLMLLCSLAFAVPAAAAEKWLGTDDKVDLKMQEVTGVAAKEPLIDISQGNLGLFLFAVGGFAAGTIFGYQWRKIFIEKAGKKDD